MYMLPMNPPRFSEYAIGVGWVLPADTDCEVCGWCWKNDKRTPHPVRCDQYPPQGLPTMDWGTV